MINIPYKSDHAVAAHHLNADLSAYMNMADLGTSYLLQQRYLHQD